MGDTIGYFTEARNHLSRPEKFELVKYYTAVMFLRLQVGEVTESVLRVRMLAEYEREIHDQYQSWPYGEQIFTEEVEIGHPTPPLSC